MLCKFFLAVLLTIEIFIVIYCKDIRVATVISNAPKSTQIRLETSIDSLDSKVHIATAKNTKSISRNNRNQKNVCQKSLSNCYDISTPKQ